MVIEAVVAVAAGLVAGSLVLLAFGLDSIIELISAGVLIWRLSVELRHGQTFSERAERLASRIGGALLFALAAYVVVSAGWGLWLRQGAEFSVPGLVISVFAIPIMRYLARRKIGLADKLGSGAMRAVNGSCESCCCTCDDRPSKPRRISVRPHASHTRTFGDRAIIRAVPRSPDATTALGELFVFRGRKR